LKSTSQQVGVVHDVVQVDVLVARGARALRAEREQHIANVACAALRAAVGQRAEADHGKPIARDAPRFAVVAPQRAPQLGAEPTMDAHGTNRARIVGSFADDQSAVGHTAHLDGT
jgi:hypothetical protein